MHLKLWTMHFYWKNWLEIELTEHAVGWFSNYMTNRTWCIGVTGLSSNWLSVFNSVPQGSVLGPLLFSVSVNSFSVDTNGTQTYCPNCEDFLIKAGNHLVWLILWWLMGKKINVVSCYKYLGVWLDDRLTFNMFTQSCVKTKIEIRILL